MKSLILLNGPPRCGKDTAGLILRDAVPAARLFKFADSLKLMAHALYGNHEAPNAYEHVKDKPLGDFFGVTPRQAYIALSEQLMKPLHGEDIFGKILARVVAELDRLDPAVAIITDSGFLAEARPVAALAERVLVVRIHREGCTFEGDSRSYWPVPAEWECVEVVNPGEFEAYRRVLWPVAEWAKA